MLLKTLRNKGPLSVRALAKELGQSLYKFMDWERKSRHVVRKGEMLRQARNRVMVHLSYYAITDKLERCSYYVYRTERILFKWLNRKSQLKAYTWESFTQALIWAKWPQARIRKDLNPCRGAEAH